MEKYDVRFWRLLREARHGRVLNFFRIGALRFVR